MFRVVDERDVPAVKPFSISMDDEVRTALVERIENLKAALLNGCLLDLVVDLERHCWNNPDVYQVVVRLKGAHAYYGGQYLEMNFRPEINNEFLVAWQDRYTNKHPRGADSYEDLIEATPSSQPGRWIVRLVQKGG